MRVDLVASYPHFKDHLMPVWSKLPETMKGDVIGGEVRGRAKADRINLVAGYVDVTNNPHQPFVLVEHGAGQSYDWSTAIGDIADGSYSGGRGYNNCVGFICPNEEVARRWLTRYPSKHTAVVGCPRLDPWHAGDRGEPEERTVAITFHWDAQFSGVPETSSAFYWYHDCLFDLIHAWKRAGWRVLGHWHPRYLAVAEEWERLNKQVGIEVVQSSSMVLDRASILVADNTSMQAEFLSLGRPVVWLNHPGYRKSVEHGGRFWDWPTQLGGQQVDSPEDLRRLDLDAVPPALGHPYAFADGKAAERAAHAVQFWVRNYGLD